MWRVLLLLVEIIIRCSPLQALQLKYCDFLSDSLLLLSSHFTHLLSLINTHGSIPTFKTLLGRGIPQTVASFPRLLTPALVLQATNAGVRRPGNESRGTSLIPAKLEAYGELRDELVMFLKDMQNAKMRYGDKGVPNGSILVLLFQVLINDLCCM